MKITHSGLAMQASHTHYRRQEERESLRLWRDTPAQMPERTPSAGRIDISDGGRALLLQLPSAPPARSAPPSAQPDAPAAGTDPAGIDAAFKAAEEDPYVQLVRSMLEFLTGRPVRILRTSDLMEEAPNRNSTPPAASPPPGPPGMRSDLAMAYRRQTITEEAEIMRFAAEGVVETADGRRIDFSLSLEMAWYRRSESSEEMLLGAAARKDPLVINFNGLPPALRDEAFRFDIDGDGQSDSLPLLGSGLAFLVFDRDGDGKVSDRSELFGPLTDDGFAELARLDADANGWIDEADPAFARLGVWRPDPTAAQDIESLAAAGVGAIAASALATPFTLRNRSHEDLGQVRDTGVALTESGQSIAVHEFDLSVR